MSDGREERAEQEARQEWERQELARKRRAEDYVPEPASVRDWEPERRDS